MARVWASEELERRGEMFRAYGAAPTDAPRPEYRSKCAGRLTRGSVRDEGVAQRTAKWGLQSCGLIRGTRPSGGNHFLTHRR